MKQRERSAEAGEQTTCRQGEEANEVSPDSKPQNVERTRYPGHNVSGGRSSSPLIDREYCRAGKEEQGGRKIATRSK